MTYVVEWSYSAVELQLNHVEPKSNRSCSRRLNVWLWRTTLNGYRRRLWMLGRYGCMTVLNRTEISCIFGYLAAG